LFASGAGIAQGVDKLAFKSKEFQISTAGMSVGGVLMLTSGAWAYFSYASVPKLNMAGDLITIGEASPAIGLPVYSSKNEPVGRISGVIANQKDKPTGYIVETPNEQRKVVVDQRLLEFKTRGMDKSAVVNMTAEQFNRQAGGV